MGQTPPQTPPEWYSSQWKKMAAGPFRVGTTEVNSGAHDTRGGGLAVIGRLIRELGEAVATIFRGGGILLPSLSTAQRDQLPPMPALIFHREANRMELWADGWRGVGMSAGGLTNTLVVDPRNPEAVDGTRPSGVFKTIAGAMKAIGTPTSQAEFNDPLKRFWSVTLAPGVYEGPVQVPARPWIEIDCSRAVVQGRLDQGWPSNGLLNGVLKQSVLRVVGGGEMTGLAGDLRLGGVGAHLVQIRDCPSVAKLEMEALVEGTALRVQLLDSAVGQVETPHNAPLTLTAERSVLHALAGNVTLALLHRVQVIGAIQPLGSGGVWREVNFKVAPELSRYTGPVDCDARTAAQLTRMCASQAFKFKDYSR